MTLKVPVSLEFFPPRTLAGIENLAAERQKLYALKPEFCSVTFGAGGSTQQGTLSTVRAILKEGVAAAPHLSCIGQSKEDIRRHLKEFRDAGVRRIVALRGDWPSGYGPSDGDSDFYYARDLVRFIRDEMGDYFHIDVAAYPEMHPQARNPWADLEAFASKAAAGANSAITQYFFNADAYFRLVDELRQRGVDIPIVPGIMPINNAQQLLRFSDACGAEVPRWLRLRLEAYGDDVESVRALGREFMADLCRRLIAGGAPALHIYTLNRSAPTLALCQSL